MAKVRAFALAGIKMWFYSGDHNPPHFHARRSNEWEARVWLQEHDDRMIEILRPPDGKIKAKDRRALIEGVRANRGALLIEWEAAQAG